MPHGLANAAGIAQAETDSDEAAQKFIQAIKNFNTQFGIGTTIPEIWEEDIPKLAYYADKEANPLYPVPVLMDTEELEHIYHMIMEGHDQ